jgi:hypothetical protein
MPAANVGFSAMLAAEYLLIDIAPAVRAERKNHSNRMQH